MHRAEFRHPLPIGAYACERGFALIGTVEAIGPRREDNARRQALDVPFPWAGQRLVEVVDVEDYPPLRRREATHVQQMAITTELRPDAAGRRVGQVSCHDVRRATEEGERGHHHAAVANRHQVGDPPAVGFDDLLDGIGSRSRR